VAAGQLRLVAADPFLDALDPTPRSDFPATDALKRDALDDAVLLKLPSDLGARQLFPEVRHEREPVGLPIQQQPGVERRTGIERPHMTNRGRGEPNGARMERLSPEHQVRLLRVADRLLR